MEQKPKFRFCLIVYFDIVDQYRGSALVWVVSFLHLDLWCDTAQNVEILITLSISMTKNMQRQIKKQHFYKRTLMLQKYHRQTTKPTDVFCFYSCSFDNTNPSDSHPPCLYILDDFLYRAVEEVFPWVYHVGQCSRANTDQLEKLWESESADLNQTAHAPPCCDAHLNQ